MNDIIASQIVGANPSKERRAMDFYPTPPEVAQALVDFLELESGTVVWEPAAGEGDLANVLRKNGLKVIETDIQTGTDFITAEKKKCDWIITNPPFSIADKFIARCIEHQVPFALLLKSQYWHAKTRYKLFMEQIPAVILPLTWRPNFGFKSDCYKKASPLMDVMWVVWTPNKTHATYYIPLQKPDIKNAKGCSTRG